MNNVIFKSAAFFFIWTSFPFAYNFQTANYRLCYSVPLNSSQGRRGSLSQLLLGERRGTSQGHTEKNETHNHARSHSLLGDNLESPITWHACFWTVGGSRSTWREPTHAYTGRTYKLHSERPQLWIEPGTLLLWGDDANHQWSLDIYYVGHPISWEMLLLKGYCCCCNFSSKT